MRRPAPLPASLLDGPFTAAQARAAGLDRNRLRRSDVERLARGLYRRREATPAAVERPVAGSSPYRWSTPLSATQHELLLRLARHRATTVVSHQTAARAREIWLPERLDAGDDVHVSRPRDRGQLSLPGVTSHRTALPPADVERVRIGGLAWYVTAPPRLWVDLAALLDDDELVILGDHLVRRAELSGGPGAAERTRAALAQAAEASPSAHNRRRRLRTAATLVRVGAHSPKETRLRLALRAAGLPEPALQLEVWDPEFSLHHPATADLGYRQARVALHYDGGHHGADRQIDRDVQRNAAFERRGYRNITVSSSDARRGFTRVIVEVRRHLGDAGDLSRKESEWGVNGTSERPLT